MTGTEHYQEAERLLDRASNAEGMAHEEGLIGRAQVHATLALAAATAGQDVTAYTPVPSGATL